MGRPADSCAAKSLHVEVNALRTLVSASAMAFGNFLSCIMRFASRNSPRARALIVAASVIDLLI
jgi:hypothetical protein